MKMINKYVRGILLQVGVLLIVTVLMFPVTETVVNGEVIDRVVAVVNNDIIVLSDLNRELKPGVASIKAKGLSEDQEKEEIANYRIYMLNQLINQALIDQEIKRYGISVSDEEVEQSITQVRESKLMTPEVFEEEVKKNLGIGMEEYKEKVKEQLMRMKLINSQVQSKVVVTDKDREMFRERFEQESTGGKRYHLRNIIMRISEDTSDSEKQKLMKKMEAVYADLKKGADFADTADTYSDSSQAGEGGDLGFIRFDDLSPQLKEKLADIREGEFTPVLETDMGYQIIYVEKIEDDNGESQQETSPDIDRQIYNASVSRKFQSWLMELRDRSYIKIIE